MPPRTLHKLTDLAARKAKEPGWYGDGGGLYLRVEAPPKPAPGEKAATIGAKRWVFVFQWQKKRAEMGLGSFADVGLGDARDKRDAARKVVAAGKNPIDERRLEREREAAEAEKKVVTFGEWAEEIAPAIGPKAIKARKAWVAMMQHKVGALAQLAPSEIATEHVLAALKPYWLSRPESGKRMRQRIEVVLDAARAKGMIAPPWENPARLKGHLDKLLAKRSTAVKHRAALPFAEVGKFMGNLRELERTAAKALEFVVLTAVRNVEGRGVRWREIDFKEKLWTVPAERMKGEAGQKREHRVPLSDAAIVLLESVKPPNGAKPGAFIFPCPAAKGGMFSENALQNVVNDMGLKGRATVHGFRSTFRDWAGDMTNFQRETIEAALAHKIEDDTERAYRRSDALLKRRKLMEAWAGYLARPAADNVRQMGKRP